MTGWISRSPNTCTDSPRNIAARGKSYPETTPRRCWSPILTPHLGKLAWPGDRENYDYKICRERFLGPIARHIEQIAARRFKFEKIIYPIGNDFFNFDTIEQTTTAGTRQDSDLRWQKLAPSARNC